MRMGTLRIHRMKRRSAPLLEGQRGLGRTRWVFAEMVRSRTMDIKANEEAIMRILARIVEDGSSLETGLDTVDIGLSSALNARWSTILNTSLPTSLSAFTCVPPQSSTEIIEKVEILFNCLLHGTSVCSGVSFDDWDVFQDDGKFSGITLEFSLASSDICISPQWDPTLKAMENRIAPEMWIFLSRQQPIAVFLIPSQSAFYTIFLEREPPDPSIN
ncbi:hypothetical protein GYMLUDRAFT_248092 [Collybiopsis luxurians FD-317 M1]|uniref:Uncharacterized protein n=1 Tax=Collybiopsis luxurians FD-317 M1 TaxID=944289 RepID=A0A0D0C177_9AGAR|nr:hypothetical protein GYMLUDRAFT_248092 [Collybiopsis luxurians FD-317 M1]